jgi:sensor histidine kinase YesM
LAEKLQLLRQPPVHHVIFWTLYFIFEVVRWGFYYNDFTYSLQFNLIGVLVSLLLAYTNVYYLMPKYLALKRLGVYLLIIVSLIIAMSMIRVFITQGLISTVDWQVLNTNDVLLVNPNYIIAIILEELFIVALTSSVVLAINWSKNLEITKGLIKKEHETELAFLRSQIQPHFFFNTLNNLYFLTLAKSDQAPEMVLKLSDLMNYVIYKGRNKQVSLLDEINYIQDYIDLERLRYGERLNFILNISGDIEDKYIPPLILQPCVENSFKHGGLNEDNKLSITIDLEVKGSTLLYSVINQRPVKVAKSENKSFENLGIGIANIKRRLNLLYKSNYSLHIQESDSQYQIMLKIPIR